MESQYFFVFILLFSISTVSNADNLPIVISTWRFVDAAGEAWKTVLQKSALDAIEAGCSVCEREQCDGTVGYGGSPDEDGETTLDAMIMDGNTMNVGAVVSMRNIKNAASVARLVLERTSHSILAGEKATNFAKEMGFTEESLTTDTSKKIWQQWRSRNCQPNYWQNVIPDPKKSCGPYRPSETWKALLDNNNRHDFNIGPLNHDTIGMVAIDKSGNVAAGTSTNGATHKIPGRVGDSAIPGAGCYADSAVGAAAATGDGDVMLRFSPSFLAVEEMRRGSTPSQASEIAIKRIASHYPSFSGGVVAVDKSGQYGAACHGLETFPFSVADNSSKGARVETVTCNERNEV